MTSALWAQGSSGVPSPGSWGIGRRHRPLRIAVLEQRERAAEETSGRNSGVLHSGIHEHPCSLKGRLAREGSALAVSYALQHGIPLLRTGMVIAISWEDVRRGLWREVSMLRRLWVNAWKTNIQMSFVTPRGLRAWEPNLHTCGRYRHSERVRHRPSGLRAITQDRLGSDRC